MKLTKLLSVILITFLIIGINQKAYSQAEAGEDQEVCSKYSFLNAEIPIEGYGVWSLVSGEGIIHSSSNNTTGVSGLQKGENTFRWTVNNSGDITWDEITIICREPFVKVSDDRDFSYCGPYTIDITSEEDSDVTGLWRNDLCHTENIINPEAKSVSLKTGFSYEEGASRTVTNDYCSSTDYLLITYLNPMDCFIGACVWNWTYAFDTIYTCQDYIYLKPIDTKSDNFSWSHSPNAIIETSDKPATLVHLTDDNLVTIRYNYKPMSVDFYEMFYIKKVSEISPSVRPDIYTTKSEVNISGSFHGYGAGRWHLVSGSGNIINADNHRAKIKNLQAGVTILEWRVKQCNQTYSAFLKIIVTEDANAGDDIFLCDANNTELNATPPPEGYIGEWTLISGTAQIQNTSLFNTVVSDFENATLVWEISAEDYSSSDTLNIFTGAIYTEAGEDVDICADIFQMNANISEDGQWTSLDNDIIITNNTLHNTEVSNFNLGNNLFYWTIEKGTCSHTDSINIYYFPDCANAGEDMYSCDNTASLNATLPSGLSGYWEFVTGYGTIQNPTLYNTEVIDLGDGYNTLKWTITDGTYFMSDTTTIAVNTAFAYAGDDTTVCSSAPIQLNGNDPSSFGHGFEGFWYLTSGNGIYENNDLFNTYFTPNMMGHTYMTWRISNGECSYSDNKMVAAYLAIIKNQEDITVYASDEEVLLEAYDFNYEYDEGFWTVLNPDIEIISSSTSETWIDSLYVTNFSLGENKFLWTIEYDECIANDSISVFYNPAGVDQEICTNTTTLDAINPFPETGYWTVITGNAIFANATLHNTEINDLASGLNELKWTVGENADTIKIINNGFYAYPGENDTICYDHKIMNAEQPGNNNTGEWSLIEGVGIPTNPTIYNTEITGLGKGDNVFEWTITRNGCSDANQIRIYNALPSEAIISNVDADFENESCDGTVTLTAVNPIVGTGTWEETTGSGLSGTSTVNPIYITGLAANNNVFTWTIYNTIGNTTCTSSIDTTIINNYVITDAGVDDIVCEGQAQLHAVQPVDADAHYWTNLAGGSITIDSWTDNETWIRNLPITTSTFRWTTEKGNCIATDDVEITNSEIYSLSITPETVCDENIELQGNAYIAPWENGYWTIGLPNTATFIDASTDNFCDVTGLSIGANEFTWHVYNPNCSSDTTIQILNNYFIVDADTEDLVRICEDTYTLRGDNPSPGTGVWTKITGSGIVANDTQYNSVITNLDNNPTRLEWTVYKNNCVASDQVTIINNKVVASATFNFVTCNGSAILDGNNPSPGTGEWIKVVPSSSGDIIWSSMSNATVSNIDEETTIALKWVVTNAEESCKDSVQVSITNNQFSVSAGDPATTCSDSIQLDADNVGSGQWNVIGGSGTFANTADAETWVTNLNQGDNIFQWTVDQNDCQAVNSVTITNNSVNADAGEDQEICTGYTALSANNPLLESATATGQWIVLSGAGDFVNETFYGTEVNNLGQSKNIFQWTVYSNDCENSDIVTITDLKNFTSQTGHFSYFIF